MYTKYPEITQSSAALFVPATHELAMREKFYLTSLTGDEKRRHNGFVDTTVMQLPEKPFPLPTWKESDLVPNPK